MRFGLSLPMQHPIGEDLGRRFAELLEQIELHRRRLGVQEMGCRLHWPGMPHEHVLRAIAVMGERVLPHFA